MLRRISRSSTSRPLRFERLENRRVLSAGSLDPSFGVDGRVLTDIGTGTRDRGNSIAASQSDGKMIVIGSQGGTLIALRYHSDGSLDASFGEEGVATIEVGETGGKARGVAFDSQGRILLVGFSYGELFEYHEFLVARLTSQGELDTSFSGDGIQMIDFGSSSEGHGVVIDGADRVIVAGLSYSWSESDFVVARLTSSGALDTSFSGDGKRTIDLGGFYEAAHDVALDSLGRILLAGHFHPQDGYNSDYAVVRLTDDGALDPSFSEDGKQTIDFGGRDRGYRVTADAADRIIVAGNSGRPEDGSRSSFAAARLTSSGELDTSFNGNGLNKTAFGRTEDTLRDMALDSQGRIILAGLSEQGGSTGSDFAVLRFTPAGTLDPSFGESARRTIDFGNTDDFAYGVAVDGADNVLLAGTSQQGGSRHEDIALARLTPEGALDPNFDADGRVLTNVGRTTSWDLGRGVAVYQSDGKVVVAGSNNSEDSEFTVIRYNIDGSLDATFGEAGIAKVDFGDTSGIANALALDSQGRILVVGVIRQDEFTDIFAAARLTSDGMLDTSFSTDGKQTIDFLRGGVQDLILDNLGRIVLVSTVDGTGEDFAVARLSDTGDLDVSFSDDGKQTIDFFGGRDFGQGVAVDHAGNIILVGSSRSDTQRSDFAVVRLTSDGLLDTSFGWFGRQLIDFGRRFMPTSDYAADVALDSQGRILVVGNSNRASAGVDYDFAIARLTGEGLVDTSFGSDGKLTIDFGGMYDGAVEVAVDSQDRVLVAGENDRDFAVARLTPAGAMDRSFNNDGKQTIDFGGTRDEGYGLAVDSADNVIVVGESYQEAGPDIAVARLLGGNPLPVLTGDYDGSGQVEQGDLDLVLSHWGDEAAELPEAWTHQRPTTGVVDQAELDAVLSNWGDTIPQTAAALNPLLVETTGRPQNQMLGTAADVWPAHLTAEATRPGAVSLNHARAEEERRGLTRWFRPEFPNPDAVTQQTLTKVPTVAPTPIKPAAKLKKHLWPKTFSARTAAVQSVLATIAAPAPYGRPHSPRNPLDARHLQLF